MKKIPQSMLLAIFFALNCLVATCFAEQVSQGKAVSIHYTLKLDDGTLVTSTRGTEPLTYIQGTRAIVPGLEKALEGLSLGDEKKVVVEPAEGYGDFQPGKIVEVPKSTVKGDLKPGAFLQGSQSTGEVVRSKVLEVKEDTVVIDFNHPMAGKRLFYDVKIVGIQDSAASDKAS